MSWGLVVETLFHSYNLARRMPDGRYERELSSTLLLVAFFHLFHPGILCGKAKL
jgi:hypothetical protein